MFKDLSDAEMDTNLPGTLREVRGFVEALRVLRWSSRQLGLAIQFGPTHRLHMRAAIVCEAMSQCLRRRRSFIFWYGRQKCVYHSCRSLGVMRHWQRPITCPSGRTGRLAVFTHVRTTTNV